MAQQAKQDKPIWFNGVMLISAENQRALWSNEVMAKNPNNIRQQVQLLDKKSKHKERQSLAQYHLMKAMQFCDGKYGNQKKDEQKVFHANQHIAVADALIKETDTNEKALRNMAVGIVHHYWAYCTSQKMENLHLAFQYALLASGEKTSNESVTEWAEATIKQLRSAMELPEEAVNLLNQSSHKEKGKDLMTQVEQIMKNS